MGPLGGPEIILIFIVILLLFGAKKLPELARGMGKSLGEFKRAKDEFEHEIMTADQDAYHGRSEEKREPVKKEEEIASSAVADSDASSDDQASDSSGSGDSESGSKG